MEIVEYLLAKKKAEASAPTIEQLSVTENGTYSEEGIAYSPVVVNVPAPENSYQLTDLPTGAVSTISDGTDLPMPSLKAGIEPVQDLNGYDHPWAGGAGKNLFDKDNANVFNGYIASEKVTVNSNHRCVYIPCKPNTTYTVQKIAVANGDQDRFAVGYCDILPADNVDCYDIQSVTVSTIVAGTLLTLTIATGANASYLILWVSTATYYSQSITTAQVEQGSTATSYEPYSNICPISGWTAANVTRSGKNLLKITAETQTIYGVTFTVNDDGTIVINGTSTNLIWFIASSVTLNGNFIMDGCPAGGNAGYGYSLQMRGTNNVTKIDVGNGTPYSNDGNSRYLYIRLAASVTYNNVIFKPMIRLATEADSTYEPYTGQTYNIQFKDGDNPLTVYGGTLDVISGLLTVTDAYIASYAGETLPSTWISDRDVYAEGITPTTGAEVVYTLENSVTYHLTPTQIRTLVGNNNIWADTGDIIEGKYFKEL